MCTPDSDVAHGPRKTRVGGVVFYAVEWNCAGDGGAEHVDKRKSKEEGIV